jgi:hypothetical protein
MCNRQFQSKAYTGMGNSGRSADMGIPAADMGIPAVDIMAVGTMAVAVAMAVGRGIPQAKVVEQTQFHYMLDMSLGDDRASHRDSKHALPEQD